MLVPAGIQRGRNLPFLRVRPPTTAKLRHNPGSAPGRPVCGTDDPGRPSSGTPRYARSLIPRWSPAITKPSLETSWTIGHRDGAACTPRPRRQRSDARPPSRPTLDRTATVAPVISRQGKPDKASVQHLVTDSGSRNARHDLPSGRFSTEGSRRPK